MSKELTKVESDAWTPEQVQLIKDTVAKGTTDDEFKLFMYMAKKSGLDPLAKQIHALKRWNSQANREVMSVQTGIDGYRLIADRTGALAGIDNPVLEFYENGFIQAATVTVYKIVQGLRVGFSATAYYDEYVQTKKDGSPNAMWSKMPKSQLAKCAEALALRKAFPNDLSGIYTHEEMQLADSEAPVKASPVDEPNKPEGEPVKVTPQNYMDGFPSKYGTKDKPNFCAFCGENHIVKDDRITKDDTTGKYGSVVCKQIKENGNEPTGEKADPRIAKLMVHTKEDLVEIAQNTEVECFGDPEDAATQAEFLAARYDAINKKILQIKELDKNSKGQLSRYVNYLTDTYRDK